MLQTCKYCEKSLHNARQKFCNHSCSGNFYSLRRYGKCGKQHTPCLNCGNLPRNAHNIYCNKLCETTYKSKLLLDAVITAGSFDGIVIDINSITKKKILIRIRGYACEICKISHWNDELVLLVFDHINGNAEDNRLTNVRLVCPNCDGLLPTYGGKNRGNGRTKRRLHEQRVAANLQAKLSPMQFSDSSQ